MNREANKNEVHTFAALVWQVVLGLFIAWSETETVVNVCIVQLLNTSEITSASNDQKYSSDCLTANKY